MGVFRHENQSKYICGRKSSRPRLHLGIGSAGHRCSGLARRHHHDRRKATSAARSEFRRRDQGEGLGVEAVVGAARRAAEGRAQRAAHHDGRRRASARRARSAASSRRRRWIASPTAGCATRNFHSTSLCSPTRAALITGRNHHVGRLRGGGRNRDGIPGLRLDHPDGERHHRHDPEGERLRDLVVRQEPQHALLPGEPGRAVRSMAERHGLRIFLRLRRRRRQPVAAEPVPQHDGHLSLRGQSRLESDDGDGRRGDPVHEAAQGDRARQAVLRLLRAGRHPCAASSDAGVDQEDQRHAPVRRRLEQAARDHLRQPEAAGHHARRTPS